MNDLEIRTGSMAAEIRNMLTACTAMRTTANPDVYDDISDLCQTYRSILAGLETALDTISIMHI